MLLTEDRRITSVMQTQTVDRGGIIGALFVPELLESSALDSLSAGLCRKCVRRSADVQTQTADEPRWRQARQNILVSLAFSPSLTFFLASNGLETKDRAILMWS